MLESGGRTRLTLGRTTVPVPEVEDHLAALGDKVQELYLLGVEPTLRPEYSKTILELADQLGMAAIAATNGSLGVTRFNEAFSDAIKREQLHTINVSLDSIDPTVHNQLRGKKYAFDRTMETIDYAIANNYPLKVITTVWPANFSSVMNTVEALYERGVRGFSFHCGSLEGVDDPETDAIEHLDPLAWRALCAKLWRFREEHKDDLQDFFFPYIFFTRHELSKSVIGNTALLARYDEHVALMELTGDTVTPSPVKGCPGLGIPQVYVYGNDGEHKAGAVSLCSIHDNGTGTYFADYNPDSRAFEVRQDDTNQMQVMKQSPNLCPAKKNALKDGHNSDRYITPRGDLYHGCRYISSNQLPDPDSSFGEEDYEAFIAKYGLNHKNAEI